MKKGPLFLRANNVTDQQPYGLKHVGNAVSFKYFFFLLLSFISIDFHWMTLLVKHNFNETKLKTLDRRCFHQFILVVLIFYIILRKVLNSTEFVYS